MKTFFNLALFVPLAVVVVSASQEKNENGKEENSSLSPSNVHVNNTPLPRLPVGPFSIYALRDELRDSSSNFSASTKENSEEEMPPQYFNYSFENDGEIEIVLPLTDDEMPPQNFECDSERKDQQ